MLNNINKGKLKIAFPFFVALFFGLISTGYTQIHELGIGLGGSNYVGDLRPTYTYENYRIAGEGFYRYNLSEAITLRGNLLIGKLTGQDMIDYDYLNQRRARDEFNITIFELGALIEYNFFNYRDESGLIRWTPYFVGGVGFTYLNKYAAYNKEVPDPYTKGIKTADFSSLQPVIPLGIGVKYAISPQWTVGAEWVARKTFTDYLDNTGAIAEDSYSSNPYKFGIDKHKDWYFFTGLTLSYTIWTIPCPFDYE